MDYRQILLAVDFADHAEPLHNRALNLSRQYQAGLDIIHVVENIPVVDASFGPSLPIELDLTEQLLENARQRLARLGEQLQVPPDRRWLELGSPKAEIIRVAKERGTDLIVVGSHGRHGISRLFGSTASGVVHHAECDVLAVRLFN